MTVAEADNTTYLIVLALAALGLTALVVIAARRQQFLNWALRSERRDEKLAQREQRETEALAADVIQQFESVSRRLSDELTEKSRELRELIAKADQRIAGQAVNVRPAEVERSAPIPPAACEPLPATRAPHGIAQTSDALELNILGSSLTVPTRRPRRAQTVEPRQAATSALECGPLPDDLPPTMLRVWELADQGSSPSDIAEQTGLMLGEAELLLNLRKLN